MEGFIPCLSRSRVIGQHVVGVFYLCEGSLYTSMAALLSTFTVYERKHIMSVEKEESQGCDHDKGED